MHGARPCIETLSFSVFCTKRNTMHGASPSLFFSMVLSVHLSQTSRTRLLLQDLHKSYVM